MDLKYYILREGEIVAATMMEWSEFFETSERVIEQTDIPCEGAMQSKRNPDRKPGELPFHIKVVTNTVRVSTVFLGLDHNWSGNGPPIVFETMIFGGEHDEYCDRCATLAQARKMHTKALWLVRGSEEVAGGAM